MFERYSERARRAVFFSRYEASQLGSPAISPEHLLLGVLREGSQELAPIFKADAADAIRKEIEERPKIAEKISISVDLPLDNAAKRALAYAAEEAERAAHFTINIEHLAAGLLREEKSLAAELLRKHGATLEAVRELLAMRKNFRSPGGIPAIPRALGRGVEGALVEIHGAHWGAPYIREAAAECRRYHWEARRWTPRDALRHRETQKIFLYSGQSFDAQQYEVVKSGWEQDHCVICWWELSHSDPPERRDAYWNGQEWLCGECFERFIKRRDFSG